MTEDLLHFIWKFKLIQPKSLFSIGEMPLQIIKCGEHNTHAGPDFTNARIKLGDTEWAGNVEIHKKSSDWFVHNHHTDPAYDNVILHVVYEYDKEIRNSKKQVIPCFELKNFIEEDILQRYENIYKNKQKIPCGKQFGEVPAIVKEPWLERMLIERLEGKTQFIQEIFEFTQHNWDETLYLLLCKNFGFKINGDAFLQLGKSVPLHTLLKHVNSIEQTEALLYGQSGLLDKDYKDTYIRRLKAEYEHLQHKYPLPPAIPHTWKFLRLRPSNFPTIRIAQMAGFVSSYQHTFSKMIEATSVKEVKTLFQTSTSSYWKNHYVFDEQSVITEKKLGNSSIENILINTVCPLLFFYGKTRNEEHLCEKAIAWLYELKPESNHITKQFEKISFKPKSAGQSQSLLQLHTNYCSAKKCLQCGIGTHILKAK